MRNLAWFFVGVLIIGVVAVAPEMAHATTLTTEEFQAGVAETQQIMTGIAHSLAWCLGVVAGRFR